MPVQNDPMQQVRALIDALTGRMNQGRPMSEQPPVSTMPGTNIPSPQQAGVSTSPATPDLRTTLGGMITQGTGIPGAGIPMPQKQQPRLNANSAYQEYRTIGGHRNATFADIAGNVREVIQTAQRNKQAKEARNLAIDIERVSMASAGYYNPDGTVNQENAQILKDIMDDPKKMKKIREALNVSYLGDDKRKPEYKQAADIARKNIDNKLGAQANQGASNQQAQQVQQAAQGQPQQPQQGQPPQPQPGQQQGQQGQQQQDLPSQLRRSLGLPTVAQASPELQLMNNMKPEVLKIFFATKDEQNKLIYNDKLRRDLAAMIMSEKDKDRQQRYWEMLSDESKTAVNASMRYMQAQMTAKEATKRTAMIENRLKSVQAGTKEEQLILGQINSLTQSIKVQAAEVLKTPEDGWSSYLPFTKTTRDKEGQDAHDRAVERYKNLQKNQDELRKLLEDKRTQRLLNQSNINIEGPGVTPDANTGSTPRGASPGFDEQDFYDRIDKAATAGENFNKTTGNQ